MHFKLDLKEKKKEKSRQAEATVILLVMDNHLSPNIYIIIHPTNIYIVSTKRQALRSTLETQKESSLSPCTQGWQRKQTRDGWRVVGQGEPDWQDHSAGLSSTAG